VTELVRLGAVALTACLAQLRRYVDFNPVHRKALLSEVCLTALAASLAVAKPTATGLRLQGLA